MTCTSGENKPRKVLPQQRQGRKPLMNRVCSREQHKRMIDTGMRQRRTGEWAVDLTVKLFWYPSTAARARPPPLPSAHCRSHPPRSPFWPSAIFSRPGQVFPTWGRLWQRRCAFVLPVSSCFPCVPLIRLLTNVRIHLPHEGEGIDKEVKPRPLAVDGF